MEVMFYFGVTQEILPMDFYNLWAAMISVPAPEEVPLHWV